MIECVPNVSEGSDSTVIRRIADAVAETGCRILDIHSDGDHERSVLTLVGDESQIVQGAVALAERATALIDLRVRRGVHPRIGAVDVIPFVPLGRASLSECVGLARAAGRTIAERLDLPVFLYEAAAPPGSHVTLPRLRRGGFEALAATLREIEPDFGPRRPHPSAGAVAVGARNFLVAYNVVLDSSDLSIARAIARRIREVNGGLPGVKALGLSLKSRGRTQVSMNLTDVTATTVPQAFHAVEEEARRRGAEVVESEIVGLVPRVSLAEATADELRMRLDPRRMVLEDVLSEIRP